MNKVDDKETAVTLRNVLTFKSLDELRKYGDEVALTGFTPLKKGADVMAAVLTGQELGLKPMFSANNIYPINGRATLGIHAINKILLENGIITEVIRDFEPCVNFVMKGDDGLAVCVDINGVEVKRGEDKKAPAGTFPIVLKQDFADVPAKDNEVKGKKITNWKTVVRLTRMIKRLDGSFKEHIVEDYFTWNDAITAGLAEKDNWKKYGRQLTYARALTFTARKGADDLLGGLPETSEFADVNNIPYTFDEGKITIVKDEVKENIDTSKVSDAEEILGNETTSNISDNNESVSNQTN